MRTAMEEYFKFQKVYFMKHLKNSENSVPKSGVLTFETFRKSPPLFGTERSIMDNRIYGYLYQRAE